MIGDRIGQTARDDGRDQLIVVSVSDLWVTDDPNAVLVTYGLGSCIAVIVHDPVRVAGAMIHYMLPQASMSPARARDKPAMFADTGIPLLFDQLYDLGCQKDDLVVKVAGGGTLRADAKIFNIGERNYTASREVLSECGVAVESEDVGGRRSRTVELYVGDGRVTVSSQGERVAL